MKNAPSLAMNLLSFKGDRVRKIATHFVVAESRHQGKITEQLVNFSAFTEKFLSNHLFKMAMSDIKISLQLSQKMVAISLISAIALSHYYPNQTGDESY